MTPDKQRRKHPSLSLRHGALARKIQQLAAFLQAQKRVMIAYSGGVDSTFLAVVAAQTPGVEAWAVTFDTPFLPREELREARALARRFKLHHRVVHMDPMNQNTVAANPPKRCYHCKKALYSELRSLARRSGIHCICDGSNVDDQADYRPGARAAAELGIRSPLKELGFTKRDIRTASSWLKLPTADKPAAACLASRIPHGTRLTRERLRRVEMAERSLGRLGFSGHRVRLHGDLARIELLSADFHRALEPTWRGRLVTAVKRAGFKFVALDLEGYRQGSLNRTA